MSVNWRKNIPENGVLCKKQNGAVRLIKSVTGNIAVFDNQCNGIHVDELVPLTAAEWWQFAPWQNMDSIPKNKMVLIKCSNGDIYPSVVNQRSKISSAVSYKFGLDSVQVQDDFVGWLPLPTVQS